MTDNTNDPKAAAAEKEKAGKPPAAEKDTRTPCTFLPGDGSRPRPAMIVARSTADINVAELELRGDGRRVQSVPRWNEQGERPPFDVWTG